MKLYHAPRSRSVRPRWLLEQALGTKPFFLGEQFTAADIMIGSTLGWAQFMGVLEGHPGLQAYVERLGQRPAFQKAQAD